MQKSNRKLIPKEIRQCSCVFCSTYRLFVYLCMQCLLQKNNHKIELKNNTTSKQHSCVRGALRECCSIQSGASGILYYCAPLVCVSAVMEAVWWYNKPKTKNQTSVLRGFGWREKVVALIASTNTFVPNDHSQYPFSVDSRSDQPRVESLELCTFSFPCFREDDNLLKKRIRISHWISEKGPRNRRGLSEEMTFSVESLSHKPSV